ncbi:MAG: hypothetical protein ILA03_01630 [Bacteroidaceae bacterium]|nr:hypothetical protein [Bacteroidaceae bacterium]
MKASDEIIKKRKESFAETYRGKAPEKLAIIAASQHGRLYSPNADPKKKLEFRAFWENQLKELGKKYKDTPQTEDQFIKDIEILKTSLNKNDYKDLLKNKYQDKGFDKGFRLGHAQKSLSIYLKHMWCRGELANCPPVCPIDGVILKNLKNNDSWTKVNGLDDKINGNKKIYTGYRNHLEMVKAAAKNEGYNSLAEWELMKWEPNNAK